MKRNKVPEPLADFLRSARPRLILRSETEDGRCFKLTPYISEVERSCDEVTSEGFDPEHSPLGPVYWRIIKRGDERFYCSTFLVTRGQIINAWGTKGLAYRNPDTGRAVAQIESMVRAPVSRQ
jgi:hypothetical protein